MVPPEPVSPDSVVDVEVLPSVVVAPVPVVVAVVEPLVVGVVEDVSSAAELLGDVEVPP